MPEQPFVAVDDGGISANPPGLYLLRKAIDQILGGEKQVQVTHANGMPAVILRLKGLAELISA